MALERIERLRIRARVHEDPGEVGSSSDVACRALPLVSVDEVVELADAQHRGNAKTKKGGSADERRQLGCTEES